MEKVFQANRTKKQAGMTILLSVKTDSKSKVIIRDCTYYELLKEIVHQEEIKILKVYEKYSNTRGRTISQTHESVGIM